MNDTVAKRASFWRETLRELVSFAKAEWQWILIVAAIFAIEQRLAFLGNDPKEMINKLVLSKSGAIQNIEVIKEFMSAALVSTSITIATMATATYVFTVLYLRRTMREKAPEFSMPHFLYWTGKMVQKGLILYLPLLAVLLVFLFTAAPTPTESVGGFINMFLLLSRDEGALIIADKGLSALGTPNLVLLLVGNVWFFYFYFFLFLLYLVAPLAALRQEPVLRTSVELTKKHLLRIWWESIIVLVIVFAVLFPFFALNMQIAQSYGVTSPQASMLSVLLSGIWQALSGVAMAVYAVVVYRVLRHEQKREELRY